MNNEILFMKQTCYSNYTQAFMKKIIYSLIH